MTFKTLLISLFLVLSFGQSSTFAQELEIQTIKNKIKDLTELEGKENYLDSLHHVFYKNEFDSVLKNKVYYQIGYQFQKIEYWEKAILAYKKATLFAQDDDLLNGKANWKLGKTWSELKEQDSTIFYLKLALKRLPKTSIYRTHACRDMGDAYQEDGDYLQAQFYMKEAISRYKQAERAFNVAHVMNNLGTLYYDFEKFDSSLVYLQQAATIFLGINDELSAVLVNDVWINTGNVYLKKQAWDKSQRFYQKALSATLKENNQSLFCQENLAIIHRKKQEYQTAIEYLNNVLTTKKALLKTDSHPEFASIYDNLGDVYFEQKDYKTALDFYKQAIAQVTIADELAASVSTVRIQGPTAELLNFLASKAKAQKQLGNLQASLSTLYTADQLIDLMRYEHTEEASKLFWRKTTRSVYEAAIQTAFELEDAEAAFYFIEKSKAVLLADALNEQQAKESANIPKKILQKIKQLQKELTTANQAKHRNDYLEKKEELGRLIAALEKEYPAYHQFKYQKELPTIETIQREITVNDTTAFVAYFVGDSVIYSVQVVKQKASLQRVSYQKKDFQATKKLIALAADPFLMETTRWDTFLLVNQQVSALLVPTLPQKANITLSPDAWLAYLNFELLLNDKQFKDVSPSTSLSFLLKEHCFNYSYSATVLRYASKGKNEAEGQFLGVAPIDFPTLPSLSASQEQLSSIHRHLSGDCLVGNEANSIGLLEKLTKSWRILHFTTHAAADSTPYIALSDKQLLLPEIYQLNLSRTELATLSACQSSIGQWQEGEGVMSLARALTYAGASSVVASQWSIEEKATNKLMADFYAHLAAGFPKDIALRKAKLAQLEKGAPPANWAAFITIGNPAPILGLKKKIGWWLWGVILIGLLVIGYAFQKR